MTIINNERVILPSDFPNRSEREKIHGKCANIKKSTCQSAANAAGSEFRTYNNPSMPTGCFTMRSSYMDPQTWKRKPDEHWWNSKSTNKNGFDYRFRGRYCLWTIPKYCKDGTASGNQQEECIKELSDHMPTLPGDDTNMLSAFDKLGSEVTDITDYTSSKNNLEIVNQKYKVMREAVGENYNMSIAWASMLIGLGIAVVYHIRN